jgi:hypothetical protein
VKQRSRVVLPLRKDSRVSNYPRRTCGMRLPGVVALLSGCAAAGTETGHHSWDHDKDGVISDAELRSEAWGDRAISLDR